MASSQAPSVTLGAYQTDNAQASQYRYMLPCKQHTNTYSAKDVSGNAADGMLNIALPDASAWANDGYLSTVATAGGGVTVPNAKVQFDLATDSVIIALCVNVAIPSATLQLFNVGYAAGTQQGIGLVLLTTGQLRPQFLTSGGNVSGLPNSNAIFATSVDNFVMLAVSGPKKGAWLFKNGVLSNAYLNVFSGGTPAMTGASGIGDANIGMAQYASGLSSVTKTYGHHFLVFKNSDLPRNLVGIAQKLASSNALRPILNKDVAL